MSTVRDRMGVIRDEPLLSIYYLVSIAFIGFFIAILHPTFAYVGTAFLPGYEEPTHRVHSMIIGALFLTFTLGLLAQLYRPRERVSAYLFSGILAVVVFVVATAGAGMSGAEETFLFLVAAIAIGALHPSRREFFTGYQLRDKRVLALAAIGTAAFITIAGLEMNLHLTTGDSHADRGHYLIMTAGAIVVAITALVAAYRPSDWRPLVWGGAFLAIIPFGLGMIAFPGGEQGSGLPLVAAAAIVLWAAVFVGYNEYLEQ